MVEDLHCLKSATAYHFDTTNKNTTNGWIVWRIPNFTQKWFQELLYHTEQDVFWFKNRWGFFNTNVLPEYHHVNIICAKWKLLDDK